MSGVWREIWTSLKTVVGVTASAVAFCLAILGSLWDPGIKVQKGLIWLLVIALIVVWVVATAVRLTLNAHRALQPDPPRAISALVRAASADDRQPSTTLIMGRSGVFGVNILVTVYYEEHLTSGQGDVIEESIGIGQVVNIQKNGLIQVRVLKEGANHAGLWKRIRDREMAILSHVIIKPSIDFNDVGIEVKFDE